MTCAGCDYVRTCESCFTVCEASRVLSRAVRPYRLLLQGGGPLLYIITVYRYRLQYTLIVRRWRAGTHI